MAKYYLRVGVVFSMHHEKVADAPSSHVLTTVLCGLLHLQTLFSKTHVYTSAVKTRNNIKDNM